MEKNESTIHGTVLNSMYPEHLWVFLNVVLSDSHTCRYQMATVHLGLKAGIIKVLEGSTEY
jgi:hypothetical protein